MRADTMAARLAKAAIGCALACVASGCYYPPAAEPPPPEQTRVVLNLPYDIAWDTIYDVIKRNELRVHVRNPNHGIIESAGPRFSLEEADCGTIWSVAGTYEATPGLDSSSVYNFKVSPEGATATEVEVQATFSSPLRVPLKPHSGVQCVSRGTVEQRLLSEIAAAASRVRASRPELSGEGVEADAPGLAREVPITPGRPTLLKGLRPLRVE
jgi:hypothetical protein